MNVFFCVCEHLRAGEQFVYFSEREQRSNLSCEQRAFEKINVFGERQYLICFQKPNVVLHQVIGKTLRSLHVISG